MDLAFQSLTQTAAHIARREISPVELTQHCLERIARHDPALSCFITLWPEAALESARRLEKQLMQGEPLGPLHGVPLALKDLYDLDGFTTTAGSSFFRQAIASQTAFSVQRLQAAGAILLGKLNLHEIALGVTNHNPHFGPTRNPWNLSLSPGGSSGGSAAALAAGLCYGSLGSDTGGSIRIPAALCGIVGLKPSRGRISLRGVFPLSRNLDHAGPMARFVEDVALLLQVVAGYDPLDPASQPFAPVDYLAYLDGPLSGYRVALARGEFFAPVDPAVQTAVEAAALQLAQLGAQVEEADFPYARAAALANGLIVNADAAALHAERLQDNPQGFGADVRQRLESGRDLPLPDYIQARWQQVELTRRFALFFEQYDFLLLPSTPIPAPPLDGPDAVEQARRLTRFTAPFNLTGLPAISLPCGWTSTGLPVGLQLVGPAGSEAALLRLAYTYQQATQWYNPPSYFVGL